MANPLEAIGDAMRNEQESNNFGYGGTGYRPNQIVSDSGDDAVTAYAKQLNLKLDDATKGAILEYMMNEHAADNAYARSRSFTREQYTDMVDGLKKAGLNPFLAIQGLSGANQMTGQGVNAAGLYTQQTASKRSTGAAIAGGIMGALALIAMAMIKAMA